MSQDFRVTPSEILRVILDTAPEPIFNAASIQSRFVVNGPIVDSNTLVYDSATDEWVYGSGGGGGSGTGSTGPTGPCKTGPTGYTGPVNNV